MDKRKRLLLGLGFVALVLVVYLYSRGRGARTSTPSPAAATPQQAQQAATDSSQAASADLLAALAGENQQLLRGFLDSVNGLISLAGSSLGAPTSSQSVGQPTTDSFSTPTAGADSFTPAPSSTPIAAAPAAAPAGEALFAPAAASLSASYDYPAAGPIGPSDTSGGGPDSYSPETVTALGQPVSDAVPVQTFSTSDPNAYLAQFSPAPAPSTPPSYGLTYGPPAGERKSAGTIH